MFPIVPYAFDYIHVFETLINEKGVSGLISFNSTPAGGHKLINK